MAASITTDVTPNLNSLPRGGRPVVDGFRVVDFTPSTSYPTGGEPITPASLGFTTIDFVQVSPKTVLANLTSWDYTNNKLIFTVASTGAQVANAVDLSTFPVRLLVWGS